MKSGDRLGRQASDVLRVTLLATLTLAAAETAGAQQWNDSRVLALVRQATERRAQQLADSGLADYQATAHGYLTFLAQLGEGFREPPQVVKADELALQVYWRSPNYSKQRIIGRRDTTLLPTDIAYHRDHLGIVQNNFPAIIRLGDGDEVRDVPHPLSAIGLLQYDFALADSLRLSSPGRVIDVYEVKVRPKHEDQPRVIGALYIERADAQVVRMALSFTRAAFLDKQLEDLFVVLENGLVGSRFWLPRRQEIEIRRTATWLDYPVRGIIRGRWEIGEYALNTGVPLSRFAGPEIVLAPPEEQRAFPWSSARILDSLPPDVRAVTADEIRRVQAEARALVRAQALRRARGSALAAAGVSDFARFNRVEGVSLGAGLTQRIGAGVSASVRGRYGLEDREALGRAELRWQTAYGTSLRLFGGREHRDVGEVPERSTFANSLAAQELGSDFTDPFRVDAIGAAVTLPLKGWNWTLVVARERHSALQVHASPASGRFRPTLAADTLTGIRSRLVVERPTALWLGGLEMRARFELRAAPARGGVDVEIQRPIGDARLVSRTVGALVRGQEIRVQDLVYLGGPVTGPGYGFHTLAATGAATQRLELRLPVSFPSVSLGRFGRSSSTLTAAPFVSAVGLHGDVGRGVGVYPSAGLGLLLLFDLLRVDVARGLRDGRWTMSIDASQVFWSVL